MTDETYDRIATALMVFGVFLNVYLLVDAASEGALTRSVSQRWSKFKEKVHEEWDFQRQAQRVINHATWATMEDQPVTEERDGD